MSPHEQLFRDNAVNQLNVTELNTALIIIKPSSWLALIIVILLLVALVIWTCFGTIVVSVEAPGIVVADSKVASASENLRKSLFESQKKFNVLKNLYQSKLELYKKHYLTIMDVLTAKESLLQAQLEYQQKKIDSAVNFNVNKAGKLNILMFVSYIDGHKIKKFMQTYSVLAPESFYATTNYEGIVTSISDSPISKNNAVAFLENDNLVEEFFSTGTSYLARVILKEDKGLQPGSVVNTKIIYQKCHPIQFLIKSIC